MEMTLADFKKWLESFEPEAVVGLAQLAEECPIANCYRHLHPESRVEVYQDCLEVDGYWEPHAKWSKAFVEKVDCLGYRTPVTAREALRLLEGL